MKIERETIMKVAHLARLELEESELAELTLDMEKILGFMDKLNELNTDDVQPLIYMSDESNVLRNDEVKQEISHEEALLNAPKKDSDFFRVAKVIEQ